MAMREEALKYGLKVKEVAQMFDTSPQTLNAWLANNPERIEIILIGCKIKKKNDSESDK